MKKKTLYILVGIALTVTIFYFYLSIAKTNFELVNAKQEVTIYKSSNCGCCEIYADYFRRRGNENIEVVNEEDMNSIRNKHKVPSSLSSCHTTVIGDYFVEGHVPLEAIEKLLKEKPDIKGIAMPGMPSGSPGMPGSKQSDFKIYSVNKDDSYSEFMRI